MENNVFILTALHSTSQGPGIGKAGSSTVCCRNYGRSVDASTKVPGMSLFSSETPCITSPRTLLVTLHFNIILYTPPLPLLVSICKFRPGSRPLDSSSFTRYAKLSNLGFGRVRARNHPKSLVCCTPLVCHCEISSQPPVLQLLQQNKAMFDLLLSIRERLSAVLWNTPAMDTRPSDFPTTYVLRDTDKQVRFPYVSFLGVPLY
jgi:hypothetical protein